MTIKRSWSLFLLIIALAALVGCTGSPPTLNLIVDSGTYSADATTYCWSSKCVDGVFPPAVEDFWPVSADGSFTLEFDGSNPDNAFIGLDLFETYPEADSAATFRAETVSGQITWTPNVPSGDYILSVSGRWDGNDAAYHFGVHVP